MKDRLINIQGISEPVQIVRSKRKTLSIQITEEGNIIAHAPLKMSETEIQKFLLSKKKWIETHLQKVHEVQKKLETLTPFTEEEIQQMAEKALQIIPERVKYYAPLIGVTYGRITIRNQKTRWGAVQKRAI